MADGDSDDGSDGVPGSLTPLVGRDRELEELSRLLIDHDTRLLTLIGPGGVGKTRLASELGRSLRGEFDEGARFVPLEHIADARLVLPTIARALVLRDAGTLPLRNRLRDELEGRSLLLILDNFEHLLDAAGEIGELLTDCPSVKVVATSRARLAIRGEHVVVIAPLALPDEGGSIRSPLTFEAVQLFLARVREADASFSPDPSDADAIAEICRRLDGLPLAIELAAPRVRVLPPKALLARLESRLPILTGGARDVPERQRTLRAAIAWSYDLLSPGDQAVFRRLSVFKGSFTLAAAERVAKGPALHNNGGTVLDHLSSLTDWSLLFRERVRPDDRSTLDPRYVLLTTVREFGLEHLDASGEADEIRDLHAAFYADLAREARRRLTGPDQADWLNLLEFEHDNMRAALDWLTARGEAERALTLAADLWLFWFMRGFLAEGRRILSEVLALPIGGEPGPARMRALTGAGALAEAQGDDAAATALLDEAIAVGTSLDRADLLAIACTFRGLVAFDLIQRDAAVSFCERGLELAQANGDAWCAGIAMVQLGLVAIREHRYDEAKDLLDRSLQLFESIAHQSGVAIATGGLGILAIDLGECDRAATLLGDSLTIFQAQGDRWGVASYLEAAMRAASGRRQPAMAAFLAGAVQTLHASVGIVVKGIYRESYERKMNELRRELGEAAFTAAFDVGRAATPVQAVATAVRAAETGPDGPTVSGEKPATPSAAAHGIGLTARQTDVLKHLVEGMTDREIGAALFIGHRTVATHVGDLMNKMGVNSRTAVVANAVRLGLI